MKFLIILYKYFSPVGVPKCCDQFVCLSVFLSVREHISGTAGPIFMKFLCRSPVVVARPPCYGSVAICYVLPVLWMTSRLAIMGRMAMHGRLNL